MIIAAVVAEGMPAIALLLLTSLLPVLPVLSAAACFCEIPGPSLVLYSTVNRVMMKHCLYSP